MSTATSLVLVILLGVVAQWAAASLRAPSILLLLLSGFIVGPVVTVDGLDIERGCGC